VTRYDIVALGDINMDYVVARSLSFPLSSVRDNGLIHWEDIDEVPGGAGLNFCAFAAEAGYRCFMLGKVGGDSAGAAITSWLTSLGVAMPARWTDARPTGKALIMRDSSGIRFIVNNRTNANHALSVADVEDNLIALRSCAVLHVSGYCINEPAQPRYEATLRAMADAKSGVRPPCVVFDVVPHRVYEQLTFEQFRACTQHADILISEVSTMRRFLGLGVPGEAMSEEVARETAAGVASYYPRAVLRYGPSGCDHEILVDARTGSLLHHATDHRSVADTRGYGDRLALAALQDFFKVLPAAPASCLTRSPSRTSGWREGRR
jgi:sugar/nucleoside kinase (ribokinase family)